MSNLELIEQITMIANCCQEAVEGTHNLASELDEVNRKSNINNLSALNVYKILGDIGKRLEAIEKRLDEL